MEDRCPRKTGRNIPELLLLVTLHPGKMNCLCPVVLCGVWPLCLPGLSPAPLCEVDLCKSFHPTRRGCAQCSQDPVTSGGMGLIPGWGNSACHVGWPKRKPKTNKPSDLVTWGTIPCFSWSDPTDLLEHGGSRRWCVWQSSPIGFCFWHPCQDTFEHVSVCWVLESKVIECQS